MFRPTSPLARRGQMLITVLLLLTLFSLVGILLAYYTAAVAHNMRMYGEGVGGGDAEFPDDGTGAVNQFLGSLIYGANENDPTNRHLTNAIRGHDLMRTMYGGHGTGYTAWDGLGTFHEGVSGYRDFNNASYGLPNAGANSDRAKFINHTVLLFNTRSILLDPEFTDVRPKTSLTNFDVAPTPGGSPPSGSTYPFRAYVPKNAPYTYPDIKDLYLAAISPATGEVLVPSFHRPWVFGNLNPPNAQNANVNWTNQIGKFLILRPRPEDHYKVNGIPQFPYVPANTDGTYTGDVQNLPGGVGPQKNDSLWLDVGLPSFDWNGKRIKPLVAPLIVCLDGRLNLSAHGNQMATGGAHGSMAGFGPWEASLAQVLGTDAQTLVALRGTAPRTAGGQTQREFNPRSATQPIPSYSAVTWGGAGMGSAGAFALPGANGTNYYKVSPTYGTGYDDANSQVAAHAALFNPVEWPAATGFTNRTFALSDTKFLNLRYAFSPGMYSTTSLDLAGASPLTTLRGTPSGYQFPARAQQTTVSNYRKDPAHANRMLFTTRGFGLDLPGMMPAYRNTDTATGGLALRVNTTTGFLENPNSVQPYPDPSIALSTTGPVPMTDFDTTANGGAWKNAGLRTLGAVDLNAYLTDYRTSSAQPLSPANVGNYQLAWQDRQRLAMKILQRLVVATGAQAVPSNNIAGDIGLDQLPAPGTAEFNAIRRLAQIAVNLVDGRDDDDISTPFVWRPLTGGNYTSQLHQDNFSAAELPYRVVFGTEKPRLVLNEVYSETCNDPTDTFTAGQQGGTKPCHVRFWLELQNPTGSAYSTGIGPLGDGSSMATPPGTVRLRDVYTDPNTGASSRYSPYRVEIVRSARNSVSALLKDPLQPGNPENVTGGFGVTPDLIFDFSPADQTAGLEIVQPASGGPDAGMRLCAADVPQQIRDEFSPSFDRARTIWGTAPGAGTYSSLTYLLTPQEVFPPNGVSGHPNSSNFNPQLKQHVVALRRLSNPYMPPNDPASGSFNAALPVNVYVTVDYMDWVPSYDVVYRGFQERQDRSMKSWDPNGMRVNPGYDTIVPPGSGDTILRRASVGKVQPYAAYSSGTIVQGETNPSYSFPTSMVLRAEPKGWAGGVKHTFDVAGRNNSAGGTPTNPTFTAGASASLSDTLMTPFDWMIHYDRPLINPMEVLHLHTGKPHELTLNFVVPDGAGGVIKYASATPSGGTNLGPWLTPGNSLYRAFELLRTQPYGTHTAFGGRVPGKININTIQDYRVFKALFDRQPGNTFTDTDIQNLWTSLIGSRTPLQNRTLADGSTVSVPNPLAATGTQGSVHDVIGGTDRPFMSFGVPEAAGSGSGYVLNNGSGIDDTLLRRDPTTFRPLIWVPNASMANANDPNPYLQSEAARKVFNSFTTVSHTFAVYITVGYFEVYNEGNPTAAGINNWPTVNGTTIPYPGQLGKEVYRVVPGDLRQKFFAVVDRSHLTPITSSNNSNFRPPVFGALQENVAANTAGTTLKVASSGSGTSGWLYSDPDQPQGFDRTTFTPGMTLYVGQPGGSTVEQVTVTAATYTPGSAGTNGITTLTVSGSGQNGGLQYAYPAGACVSNVRPGGSHLPANAQGDYNWFDYNNVLFKPVVPFVSRVP